MATVIKMPAANEMVKRSRKAPAVHPIERARAALLEAAEVEGPYLAQAVRRVAESLPRRGA